ncbi:MAG: SEC-C domain-containing protein [Pirellulales bacterium]|nr:SEC-C domain-containing protein [Pirellulales bacterium]
MSGTEGSSFAAAPRQPRIRWQFAPDVPTSGFFDGINLDGQWGLQEAVENFIFGMQEHRYHAWEGVLCQEQGVPPTPEQAQASDELFSFGPSDDEEPPQESRVLYINGVPRPTEPWYETLRKIAGRLLLNPFEVAVHGWDCGVYCHGWNELEACVREHAAGLSLPEDATSPLDVLPAALRHRLRLQSCFCSLPCRGYGSISLDDPENPIERFIEDLRASREAIEHLDPTLESLLRMVTLPDDERAHFVRLMEGRLGLASADEPLGRRLFDDWLQRPSIAASGAPHPAGGGPDAAKDSHGRLPAESVKRAILHPKARIREMAVHYFSDSFTGDTSLMPLVIEALETHGKEDAYRLVGGAVALPQTAETIDWVIRELNDERSPSYESYTYNLGRVLWGANPRLLEAREDEIAAAVHLLPGAYEIVAERIEMLSWDADRCWRELELHCEQHQDAESTSDAYLDRAGRIVEALARHGVSDGRVLDLLAQEVDAHARTVMTWMEPMIVQLAGRLRMQSAVPLLIGKMRSNDDLLPHECEIALIRIGGDAVAKAVADAFAGANRRFRLFATGVLENIHTDQAVELTIQRIRDETDAAVARRLRDALLDQFTPAAIEPARQWLLEQGFADWEDRGLRNELLVTCELIGERFPEFEQWTRDYEAEERERLSMLEGMKDDPIRTMLWALEQLTGKKSGEVIKEIAEKEAIRAVDSVVRQPSHGVRSEVGRNDPCPCGSGKKYKKCCMRK